MVDQVHFYESHASVIARCGRPSKTWDPQTLEKFKQSCSSLIQEMPALYGYHIKLALAEFSLGNSEKSLEIYKNALLKLPAIPDLWVSYLNLLLELHSPFETLNHCFLNAKDAIGSHFLSHNFWDLYLLYLETYYSVQDVGDALYDILVNRTIHQFSRYFDRLQNLVESKKVVVPGLEALEDANAGQHLLELYTRQQKRVSRIFRLERGLRRPFYHPKPLPQAETAAWTAYFDACDSLIEKNSLWQRWLVVQCLNETAWLNYIRWRMCTHQDVEAALVQADAALPKQYLTLRLYRALWLEFKGRTAEASELYKRLLDLNDGKLFIQYSQFVERQGTGSARQVLEKALQRDLDKDSKTDVVCEYSNYEPRAFELHTVDTPRFWEAYIEHVPQDADIVFEHIVEPQQVERCLELLAEVDVGKYIEMDRIIHR